MRHVDGNAMGGLLWEVFGAEMTHQLGCCAGCGAVNPLATLTVYRDAPGEVARCPACGTVSIVVVRMPHAIRVTIEGVRWLQIHTG
ncbi:MAG: DUF6510 family protein [Actinobacteria bacterium]|nr:DUF6510 family protein [Actinomycetota bacterium]MCI0543982.1 DUF6510 family protein [Actinomycetota bacterium]MCI0679317.1 DUF6510 family protein [Actinomycetota bacterium]